MFMLSWSSPRDSRNTNFFSTSIFPIFGNLFILGDCSYHHPIWNSKGTSDHREEEIFYWVISPDLLNDPNIPNLLNRSFGSRPSPDISFAPSSLVSWRYFRTWVLIIYQFYKPSLFVWSFAPTNVPLPSIFVKLVGMTLLFTLTLTVFLQKNTRPCLFGKGGSGQLANCSLLRPPFSFQQAEYVQVFLLKPAPFCKLFAGLGSTNKSATSLLLSDSRSVLATLFSSPSFLLPYSLWEIWQELSSLSSCSIRLQWVHGHSFLLGNDTADDLLRRGALLLPFVIPCSLSSLISRIHPHLHLD